MNNKSNLESGAERTNCQARKTPSTASAVQERKLMKIRFTLPWAWVFFLAYLIAIAARDASHATDTVIANVIVYSLMVMEVAVLLRLSHLLGDFHRLRRRLKWWRIVLQSFLGTLFG